MTTQGEVYRAEPIGGVLFPKTGEAQGGVTGSAWIYPDLSLTPYKESLTPQRVEEKVVSWN